MSVGDVLALTIIGAPLISKGGQSVPVAGIVAAIQFSGMAVTDTAATTAFDPSSLTLTVTDSGTLPDGTTTTVTRTIKGTLPFREPFPPIWVTGTVVAAKRYRQNGDKIYYTAAGGTTGATAPTHTTGTVSDGAVAWTFVPDGSLCGYFDAASGPDAIVYAVLDSYIYTGTTLVSAVIGASAYVTTGPNVSSNASASIPTLTNSSTLAYEVPIVGILSAPHRRSTGSIDFELIAKHGWGKNGSMVPCVKMTAWNAARTVSSPTVLTSTPVLSNIVTAASPSGVAAEVYRCTLDTSGIPAGESFIEYQVYSWLGTRIYDSRYDGEGADWQPSKNYPVANMIIRNGTNFYITTIAGTSAASGGPTGTTSGIVDGGVTWNYLGADQIKQNSRNPAARPHFYNDPASAYKKGYCFVDPSGTATGVAGVYSTFAAANAAKGTLANCYPTALAAGAAILTFNGTTATGMTTHADTGGGEIYLKAGTHAGLGGSMGGQTAGSEWLYVRGDPAATAGTVIYSASVSAVPGRRMWMGDNITINQTAGYFIDSTTDGSVAIAQPTTEFFLSGAILSVTNLITRTGLSWVLNCVGGGSYVGSSTYRAHTAYLAGCSVLSGAAVQNAYNNSFAYGGGLGDNFTDRTPALQFVLHTDNVFIGSTTAGTLINNICAGATFKGNPYLGLAWDQNIVESNFNGCKCIQLAADNAGNDLVNVVFTNNTHVGERTNAEYNDTDAMQQLRTSLHTLNNVLQTYNIVDDFYQHNSGHPLNRNGVRSGNAVAVYAVRTLQNRIFAANGAPSYGPGFALGMRQGYSTKGPYSPSLTSSDFVSDKSFTGTAAGNGDYHPGTGSSFINMAAVTNRRYAHDGAVRRTDGTGAIGAFERTDSPIIAAFSYRRTGFIGARVGVGL